MLKSEIVTLKDAQTYVSERILKGVECPCCERHVQAYLFNLHKGMIFVLGLIGVATEDKARYPQGWIHVERYLTEKKCSYKGYHPKLEYWGLLERHPEKRGYWRITSKGIKFLKGMIAIPNTALLYQGECLELLGTKHYITSKLDGFSFEKMIAQVRTYPNINLILNQWKKEGENDVD